MSAETTLKLLFPLELGGDHAADLAIDAKHLDAARVVAESMVDEFFPDSSLALLTDWERVYGLAPDPADTIQFRRSQVLRKIRERGGLSRPYFIQLATAMGTEIAIVEPKPFMAGVGQVGDTVYNDTIVFQWGVVLPVQTIFQFTAGQSSSGEPLSWWDRLERLENLFRDLKPAHTYVYFIYIEG